MNVLTALWKTIIQWLGIALAIIVIICVITVLVTRHKQHNRVEVIVVKGTTFFFFVNMTRNGKLSSYCNFSLYLDKKKTVKKIFDAFYTDTSVKVLKNV